MHRWSPVSVTASAAPPNEDWTVTVTKPLRPGDAYVVKVGRFLTTRCRVLASSGGVTGEHEEAVFDAKGVALGGLVRVHRRVSPTVTVVGPYRLPFYANALGESPHVHVRRDRCVAEFWFGPVALARSKRFRAQELTRLEAVVREQEDELMEAWRGSFRS